MKKVLYIAAIALVFVSCKSGNKGNTQGSFTKVFETNIENVDSLAAVPNGPWKNLKTVVEGVAHSGKFSSKIDSVNQFSLVFEDQLANIDKSLPKGINFSAYGCALQPNTPVLVVMSVNNEKAYKAYSLDSLFTTTNEWKAMSAKFELPENLASDDVLKVYVWNKQKGEFLVDDYKLELIY